MADDLIAEVDNRLLEFRVRSIKQDIKNREHLQISLESLGTYWDQVFDAAMGNRLFRINNKYSIILISVIMKIILINCYIFCKTLIQMAMEY